MSYNKNRYDWKPCSECGQVVAHQNDGRVLPKHRRSKKCRDNAVYLRISRVADAITEEIKSILTQVKQ